MRPLNPWILVAALAGFLVGFLAGREYFKYEIRSTLQAGLEGFREGSTEDASAVTTPSDPPVPIEHLACLDGTPVGAFIQAMLSKTNAVRGGCPGELYLEEFSCARLSSDEQSSKLQWELHESLIDPAHQGISHDSWQAVKDGGIARFYWD